MRASPRRILLLGYGNPGRLDDGLGPALAEMVAAQSPEGVTVDSDYQLHVENAALIADHDTVVFADASVSAGEPFDFHRVPAEGEPSFTTHSVSPGALLALAEDHFDARTEAWALAIRGYEFDGFGEGLSAQAAANLAAAAEFILERLAARRFDETRAGTSVADAPCIPTA